MLSDGGDEFLGREDLEVLLVAPVGHGGAVEDFAAVLSIGNPGSGSGTSLLFGEGVPQDVFGQGLLPVPVVPGDLISGRYAETAVMPGHELFDEHVASSAFSLKHGQELGAEDLFQLLQVPFGQAITGPVRSK